MNRPSRQFTRIAITIGSILLLVVLSQTSIGKKLFTTKKHGLQVLTPQNQTLGEIIGSDQNKNGIADWEERIWGLDPSVVSTNGVSNRDIVLQKRANLQAASPTEIANTSKNNALAYDIYATSSILTASGDIDPAALQSIVAPIGEKTIQQIDTVRYTTKDTLLAPTTSTSAAIYAKKLEDAVSSTTFGKNELTVLTQAVDTNDYSKIEGLSANANTYKKLAKKVIQIRVPVVFARAHLDFVNSLQAIGDILDVVSRSKLDDISGATALGEYSNATTIASTAMDTLTQSIQEYDTLQAQ